MVSTLSRLKAAGCLRANHLFDDAVSTLSRLKAAGPSSYTAVTTYSSFNTQPPEGGWLANDDTAALSKTVSTLSRLKAAG